MVLVKISGVEPKEQSLTQHVDHTSSPVGEAVEGDIEGGLKAEVISWCCIDWPSFNNVIRLRLRKMQEALKDQSTDRCSFRTAHVAR